MPSFAAKPIDGTTSWGAGPPEFEQTDSGWTGQVDWRVEGTRDPVMAVLFGDELPKVGEPYGGDVPGLEVVSRNARPIGGVFDTASQTGGHVWVRVRYATPQANGRLPAPQENLAYTVFKGSTSSFNRVYDARKELGPDYAFVAPPGESTVFNNTIKGGRGYAVSVGSQSLEVTKFIKAGALSEALVTRMIQLQHFQAVNKERCSPPPLYKSSVRYTFDPGQLRYVDFGIDFDRGLFRLTHTLAAAPDWWVRWCPEDEFGESVGDPVLTVAYAAMDFNGLW